MATVAADDAASLRALLAQQQVIQDQMSNGAA